MIGRAVKKDIVTFLGVLMVLILGFGQAVYVLDVDSSASEVLRPSSSHALKADDAVNITLEYVVATA